MNIHQKINSVIEYLDAQSIFVTHVELGKYGNGTAELTFNFSKKSLSPDQVTHILSQFGKNSVTMTACIFADSPDNANLGIATVHCTYDFTQQLDKEEFEKIAAAKGSSETKLYREDDLYIGKYKTTVSREVRIDDQGNFYGTPFWKSSSPSAKGKAESRTVKITKEEAEAPSGIPYSEVKGDPYISC